MSTALTRHPATLRLSLSLALGSEEMAHHSKSPVRADRLEKVAQAVADHFKHTEVNP